MNYCNKILQYFQYSTGFLVHWHLVLPYYHCSGTAMSCSLHYWLLNPLHRHWLHFSGFISITHFMCWVCLSLSLWNNPILLHLSPSISCPSASLLMASPLKQGRGAACPGNCSSGIHLQEAAQPFLQSSKAWTEQTSELAMLPCTENLK